MNLACPNLNEKCFLSADFIESLMVVLLSLYFRRDSWMKDSTSSKVNSSLMYSDFSLFSGK
jgi:hypothetical protein